MGFLSSLTDSVAGILDPGDVFGREATEVAGEIEANLLAAALDLRKEFFGELREDSEPVRDARDRSLDMIKGLRNGSHQLPSDPSTQFQKDQASRNIRNAMAARGKLNSGGRFMAEQDALAGIASRDVNANINRLLNSAGFNTSNLTTNNQLLQNQANGIAGNQSALTSSIFNSGIRSDNLNNQLLNGGVTFLAAGV